MKATLPGRKSTMPNRVPLAGGGIVSWRLPKSSTDSPIGMSAGVVTVHHSVVETLPGAACLVFAAGASISTFAILLASWPVITRRIGGWAGIVSAMAAPLLRFDYPRRMHDMRE